MTRQCLRNPATALLLVCGLMLWPSAGAAQYFGKNKVQYRDFNWRIYHSPHFDVYYYTDNRDLLQKVVSFAESAYDQLSQEFDYQIQNPTPLVFYETHSAFEQNNVISNFIPEGLGAFATSIRNRMFLPVDLPDPDLYELILHELTHIFQYHVLFGGSLGKGISANAPLWYTEGMASYMEGEESARDKMFVRDAVVNDRIPPITQTNVQGFFAYRFGYSFFEYVEDRWGKEGVRDLILETRSTLGPRMGRAVERAFQMEPEDFDADFRRWLRGKYLRELLETGEPSDFGRRFKAGGGPTGQQISPVASPGGDLVAAFSSRKGDVDVVLYDGRRRTLLRNLTKGYSSEFQYLVAQELTLGRKMGRDLGFSPDGNTVALFGRRDRGRVLILIDVLKGKIRRTIEMPEIEQQFSPTFNVDGNKVAFSGYQDGQFDIFEIDLESGDIRNITDDDVFDGAPTYSPDGRSLVLSSVVGGYSKLFRIDLDNPSGRIPLREGVRSKSNETDPVYSPDGKRIYFTSDGTGANNIFSLEVESGKVTQHTNSVTGCFTPTVLAGPDGKESLVFGAYWKGAFDLYRLDVEEPISEPVLVTEEQIAEVEAIRAEDLPRFEPSIEVTIDDSNTDKYGGRRFFLEGISGGTIGISDDQTFIAAVAVQFSDYLGDRKIIAAFQSIESFQNFDVIYLDLSDRLQWNVHLFDDRDFFLVRDSRGRVRRDQQVISMTGVVASLLYPFGTNHRVEAGAGYQLRDLQFTLTAPFLKDEITVESFLRAFPEVSEFFPPELTPEERQAVLDGLLELLSPGEDFVELPVFRPTKDDYPIVQAALVGDTTVFAPWGAVTGRRWRIGGSYAPDLDDSGALTSSLSLDFRQYLNLTRRSNFAFRLVGFMNDGNKPTPIYFGGLDTLRGFEFRSLSGDRGFFSNLEFRFPLVDVFATPIISFQGIRGVIFLDIGGAWFDNLQDFDLYDSVENRLDDAVASYGYGLTVRLFGLDLNWDFARRWDFESSLSGFESSFWIGTRF